MKIHQVALQVTSRVFSSADLYTLANANLVIDAAPNTGAISGIFSVKADGSTNVLGLEYGGDSVPVQDVQPSYYPKAIQGAECAAVIANLDWANENLDLGYQFVKTARGFFVAGVLNSTQTDANDPFTSSDIVAGQVSCWKEEYNLTYNPFL